MTLDLLPILKETDAQIVQSRSDPQSNNRSVYIETYGCQMNVADSELVGSILNDAGFIISEQVENADIILLNTCAVRENAEERVIGRVSQLNALRAQRPNLTIGILGCMAQHLSESLTDRAPFVDIAMGPDSYRRLPDLLAQSSDDALLDVRLNKSENYIGLTPIRREGTNAWVTIIRGCDKFCTFCIVPYVRGRERSIDPTDIVHQIESVISEGYKEVTLLGQTVNSYKHLKVGFAQLLRKIAKIEKLERLRFTSPYPVDFSDDVIKAMSELNCVCPSIHLPVQSGSETQLKSMRRGYTVSDFRRLVDKLRNAIPDIAISTDIITGFCGETEKDFLETYNLMQEIRFDFAFMFKYSEREGTYAFKKMSDDVPEEIKSQRLHQIIKLQEKISLDINKNYVGNTYPVLIEGKSRRKSKDGKDRCYGKTPQNKTAVVAGVVIPNTIVDVKIEECTSHTLYGRLN